MLPLEVNFPLFSAEQVKRLDAEAIRLGTPGFVLMKRAGQALFDLACKQWPAHKQFVVLCGAGNNGGDGWLFAALAHVQGFQVQLYYLKPPEELTAEAKDAADFALGKGVDAREFDSSLNLENTKELVLVDALLGIGINGLLSERYKSAIAWLNLCAISANSAGDDVKVLSVDLPSGINATTGECKELAVKADLCLSFIGRKQGLYTADAPNYCTELHFEQLGVADYVIEAETQSQAQCHYLMNRVDAGALKRAPVCHKGRFGHIAVVGGGSGMSGAALLAADAALHAGSGLVSLYSQEETLQAARQRLPECMSHIIDFEPDPKGEYFKRCNVLVVGPGLGQDEWARHAFKLALSASLPLLLDADALNLLAGAPVKLGRAGKSCVITPHPAEAARLLATTVQVIQADRFAAARALVARYDAVVVLKGAGTLVACSDKIWLCPLVCPSLAIGGAGDVLSGVIAALLAQGLEAEEAARLGVWLHASAAKYFEGQVGVIGLKAGELPGIIRKMVNELL
ncbi:NAD(P)H-hydrate dehydratase [Agaribacterium sp. ZY112]|uniref:NAD(P)H-hydrate dehydratase n=1 Tax=Agaribacterium sp. ZY112 TaxID=3233574 RepID=UPI003524CB09